MFPKASDVAMPVLERERYRDVGTPAFPHFSVSLPWKRGVRRGSRVGNLSTVLPSKKSLHPVPPEHHPAAARSMKLLAKIPKDAEAVIVLVGKLWGTLPITFTYFPHFLSVFLLLFQ